MRKRIRGGKSGRQKQCESDLKDEIAPLPVDIAMLDSQLCCAIWLQKEYEDKALDQAAAG